MKYENCFIVVLYECLSNLLAAGCTAHIFQSYLKKSFDLNCSDLDERFKSLRLQSAYSKPCTESTVLLTAADQSPREDRSALDTHAATGFPSVSANDRAGSARA